MGAVNFSIDKQLVTYLQQLLPLSTFVETGTFEGDSISQVLDRFSQIFSTELSQEYFLQAQQRFQGLDAVHLANENSVEFLRKLMPTLHHQSVLYWLDAHWCVATHTAGEDSQCPLLEELSAIAALNAQSIVLIDDARLFLCTPPIPHQISQWPTFNQVIQHLQALSSDHEVMVLNDVILYYPNSIQSELYQYAHEHSIDWLNVLEKLRYYEQQTIELAEKEAVIQEKQQAIEELSVAAGDRLQIIQEQEQKIAQLEYALEQLRKQHKQERQDWKQNKKAAVQKVMLTAKEQRQLIEEQVKEIEVLRRSLELTIDRRVRRKLSSIPRLFGR